MKLRHLFWALLLVVLAVAPVMAEDDTPYNQPYGYGGQMGPGMMGPGYGMGPGMMGGHGMMGPGYGMRGRRGMGYGMMGPNYQGWQGMSQADRERWQNMHSKFAKETLPIRQKLANKQMELETEWTQSKPDMEKVRKLSDQITELRAELGKKRNQFLSQCRENFGDRGWSCPGLDY